MIIYAVLLADVNDPGSLLLGGAAFSQIPDHIACRTSCRIPSIRYQILHYKITDSRYYDDMHIAQDAKYQTSGRSYFLTHLLTSSCGYQSWPSSCRNMRKAEREKFNFCNTGILT